MVSESSRARLCTFAMQFGKSVSRRAGSSARSRTSREVVRSRSPCGDAQAQSNIGYLYDHGEGVVQDDRQAIFWYRKAAVQDFALAERNLGVMYALGRGVEADEQEAIRWFERAAAQGQARASVNEAILYMQGKQIAHDYRQAYKLLQQAVAAGEQEAKPLLQQCRRNLQQGEATSTASASAPPHAHD